MDITSWDVDINLYRQKMGMVFQHFNLFPHKTVLQNITMAPVTLKKKTAEEALVAKYGESVDKSLAARIMGVTRSTVYAMIADGRVESAGAGKRVSVRSIARYPSPRRRRTDDSRSAYVHHSAPY